MRTTSFIFTFRLHIFSTNSSVAAFLCGAGSSMLESTGSHGRGVERRVPEMRRMIELTAHWPDLCEQIVTRLGRSTLLLNSKALEQMTAECWRWRPRWNRLASSTSCFCSSACLQSLSSVLCKTAYGLESPQDRLVALMPKALAIQINWQFTNGGGGEVKCIN